MAKHTRAQFLKLGGKLAAALGAASLPGCGVGSETAEGNAAADLVLINLNPAVGGGDLLL